MATKSGAADPSIKDMVAGEIKKHLDPIAGLLKSLEAPASKLGMSPEALIQKMTNNGQTPGTFAPDGRFVPAMPQSLLQRRSKGIGWNDMLMCMYEVANPGKIHPDLKPDAANKKLFAPVEQGGYGCQQVTYSSKNVGALAENSGLTGGYTVHPQFSNKLMQLAAEESIVEPRASSMPMTARTLSVPSLDYTLGTTGQTALTGGVVASWTSEAATRDETEPRFLMTDLTAWELSFYTLASNNLLADSAIALDSLLTQLFSMAIAWYTDFAYLNGNGVGKPIGAIGAANPAVIAVSRGTSSRVRYVDVANMQTRLFGRSWGNAVWIVHQSVVADLLQMHDHSGNQTTYGAGRLVFQSIDQGATQPFAGTLFGRPVLITEKVPALGNRGDISLVDLSMYLLGKRMELEIAVSPHVRFLNNQMAWRVVWRGDGQPWLHAPISQAPAGGTFTTSPFVTLAA